MPARDEFEVFRGSGVPARDEFEVFRGSWVPARDEFEFLEAAGCLPETNLRKKTLCPVPLCGF